MPDFSLIETPAILIDEDRLNANLEKMQAKVQQHEHLSLRPHVKTHKCKQIALKQIALGAIGITCSKPSEALAYMNTGEFKNLTLAYPVVSPQKIHDLITSAKQHHAQLFLTVDSKYAVEVIAKVAQQLGQCVSLMVQIDVGYHRVGVQENDPALIDIVLRITKDKFLSFGGILSHAGHSYGCTSPAESIEIANNERDIMIRIRDVFEGRGIKVNTVSVGSTPTELCRQNYDCITEIRPGNYVFQDRTPVRVGVSDVESVAISILTTVVSANETYFIVDAGSKVLSCDAPRGRTSGFGDSSFGLAFLADDFDQVEMEPTSNISNVKGKELLSFEVVKLSEEHGWVKKIPDFDRNPQVGDKIRILPNHACPVANLSNELTLVRGESQEVQRYNTFARGCVQ